MDNSNNIPTNNSRNNGLAHEKLKPTKRKKKFSALVIGIFLGIWLLIGAGVAGAWLSSKFNGDEPVLTSNFDGNKVISEEEADLAGLVKKVSASVVSIITTQNSRSGLLQETLEGAGTGMIISKDGYVMTNKHVIKTATTVSVIDSEGNRYDDVDVIGGDPLNDIAFLKIKKVDNLPVATLGDSGTVRVGQKVIAIGNSLGQYQNTVTSGIISGLGRPVIAATDDVGANAESLTDLLQTDAAINPGNSGGPLINMAGQVIGINTAIVSDAQSIGFAIPINASKGLIRGVIKDGTIQKAYLGVQYMAITPDIRAEFKLKEKQGAFVKSGDNSGSAIVSGGPADKAGLKDGDVITKVNDKQVGVDGGLGSLVSEYLPGEEIRLTIVRSDNTQEVKLTLGRYQSQN